MAARTEGMKVMISSGNYAAFARPRKPRRVECKSAYIVGTGLAALATACFLVRDGQMKGEHVHLFEKCQLPGGACRSRRIPGVGYAMAAEQALDEHCEVLWDLMRSVPSLELDDASIFDEAYWLDRDDPNVSQCRVTEKRGEALGAKFGLSDQACAELWKLFAASDDELSGRTIGEVLDDEVFNTNFWLCWSTSYGFAPWHSALELKRAFRTYMHQIDGLTTNRQQRFLRYNEYDSLILPMVHYLEGYGVRFHYNTKVTDVEFECNDGKKMARSISLVASDHEAHIDLTEDDLVFLTNGGCVENFSVGSQDAPPAFDTVPRPGSGWELWKRIAAQDTAFGRPSAFCSDPDRTSWVGATVTTRDERIVPYIRSICRREAFAGHTVTGGLLTARDSNWLLSWTFGRQPRFRDQQKGQLVGWLYGQFPEKLGNYIQKPMRECTGREICAEWLYHLGVPEAEIDDMADSGANTVPVMMPYATACLMPRTATDRPKVVPDGSVNFAFIGQFAETAYDAAFSLEYAARTGMEAAYTLLGIERAVPEPWGEACDVRDIVKATVALRDGRPLTDWSLSWLGRFAVGKAVDRVMDTDLGKLLQKYQAI